MLEDADAEGGSCVMHASDAVVASVTADDCMPRDVIS